jgi:NitT/TauT family transport system ATP-binding protein
VVVLSPRPGRITALLDVDLGERDEQTRQSPEFFARLTEVRRALRGQAEEATVA